MTGSQSVQILKCEGLRKTYAGENEPALNNAALAISSGEVMVVLGPNGAGKSTCFQIVAGTLLPDAGLVSVGGKTPRDGAAYQRLIGAILDSGKNIYPRLTAIENAIYSGALKDMARGDARNRAERLFDRLIPRDKLNQPVQKLSRGMQQRVSIACGIVHNPSLVILDEPTLGLDMPSTDALAQLVRQISSEGKAVLVATHQLDFAARIADRVAIMERGQISAPISQAELRSKALREYKITLEYEGDSKIDAALAALPNAIKQGAVIHLTGGSNELYGLLDIVRPRGILSVESVGNSLSDLVGEAGS